MAGRGRMTITKRNKERAREEKLQKKQERLARRRAEKANTPEVAPGEDPDLAGMTLGPQKLPDAFDD
jgi:hypothetical protein